ncbi:carbohydrate ABC transporter permease [Micromonospora sp. NBS 11-29]|uniref:carbohydrate ABC transporter permease n=1 Tax=Micromonospora sp. NBS 11-29 TaxID=1960879 RepID=UPI000B77438B|nr:carbohydrate ABC transporter permease [Micromonospora sp. NBS 11-29]
MTVRIRSMLRFVLLTIAALLAVGPVLWTVSTSFKTQVETQTYPPTVVPNEGTLANYARLFTDPQFLSASLTSVGVALVATLLVLAVTFPCAYALVRLRPHGRRSLILLVMLAQTVPSIVFVIPLYSMALEVGLYDTRLLLMLVYAGFLVPFTTILLASFVRGLPEEVEEAARVDGAGYLRMLLLIVLPMMRGGMASAAIFTGFYAWNEFLIPVILGGEQARPLTVYVASFVTQKTIEWGPLTAAVTLVLLPVVVVVLTLQRHLVAGLTAGATKG